MSKKENKTSGKSTNAASEITIDENYIKIGNVKLSNVDLRQIVRKSEEIQMNADEDEQTKELQNNPEFMKSLNAYASEKSKEIIDSTVFNEEVLKNITLPSDSPPNPQSSISVKKSIKIDKKVQKPPPPPLPPKSEALLQKTSQKKVQKIHRKFVNPDGGDLPFYSMPVDISVVSNDPESLPDSFRTKMQDLQPLETSRLFLESPTVIANELLKPNFPYSFKFTLDIHFGLTGIVRENMYTFSGPNTFNAISYLFKHRYCVSENFQWFYMNHFGKLMEIHDDLTMKQMLITHGAYPKGVQNVKKAHGKIMCVPRCTDTEEEIFEREADLILGLASEKLMKQDELLIRNLLYQIAPDLRYADTFHRTINYSEKEIQSPYNQYDDVLQLVLFCQRHLDSEEMFHDGRMRELTDNDLKGLLTARYHQPYKNCSKIESVNLEVQWILDQLKKSKHQTRESLDHIEDVLKQTTQRLIRC